MSTEILYNDDLEGIYKCHYIHLFLLSTLKEINNEL